MLGGAIMDIREAFDTIVSQLRENDGKFGRSSSTYVVERKNLTSYGWRVLETAVNAEGDYLSEPDNVILTVTTSADGDYVIRSRPFVWAPQNKYGFTAKMFNYIFRKYDPQLVESCVKVATENGDDGMLYSELVNTNGVCRCHYGVKVYNNRTDIWEKVYEGTFPVES